jgi:phage gpG-like protein
MGEIATIAAVHEFGAPSKNIPERSFLRTAFDENEEELKRAKVTYLRLVFDNRMTLKAAMQKLAVFMEGKVKHKIVSGPFVPLFPETIIRRNKYGRASNKPLIDTGQLLNSVQSEVLEKKPE